MQNDLKRDAMLWACKIDGWKRDHLYSQNMKCGSLNYSNELEVELINETIQIKLGSGEVDPCRFPVERFWRFYFDSCPSILLMAEEGGITRDPSF
jgi:hypothetical protein